MKVFEVKHMKIKKIIKRLISVILVLFILGLIIVSPILYKGFKMYDNAVSTVPIAQRLSELKAMASYVPSDAISPVFLKELVLEEDHRFYDHSGFSVVSIGRALVSNIKAGARIEGGSSITQQLAKNMYYSFDKTYERKVAELITALELERLLDKKEILELYSNIVYFGENCYGIQAASQHYFQKDAADLSQDEALALVRTLKSPNNRNPNALKSN